MNREKNKDWDETQNRFVNPYNFVALEEKCQRQHVEHYREGERLAGFIECLLTTRTPLIIPNTSNDKALHTSKTTVDQTYDFYSYTNLEGAGSGAALSSVREPAMPVIPGSELRGVIRSIHEAAFNGCLSTADTSRTMYRRAMKAKEAGILRKKDGRWVIVPCKRVMLNTTYIGNERHGEKVEKSVYEKWEEGKQLYVLVSDKPFVTSKNKETKSYVALSFSEESQGKEWDVGYLHKGERFGTKKHHESIFVPLSEPHDLLPIDSAEIIRLEEVLKQYGDPKLNRHKGKEGHTGYSEFQSAFSEFFKSNGQGQLLVYYSTYKQGTELKATYLTPAMMSKEVYRKTIGDLLEANGGYQPCTDREDVCPACALFGMVGVKGKASLGSRIRFADAEYFSADSNSDGESYGHLYQLVELEELGEPKPGAVEFYTMPPIPPVKRASEYKKWTYDDVLESWNKIRPLKSNQPQLRGRKFYWHHMPKQSHKASVSESKPSINDSMRKEVRAVKANTEFRFRVYFDQVTIKELAQLYWALTLGDSSKYAYKIGHGKPLGYGSVQLKPDNLLIRRIDPNSGARALSPYDFKKLDEHLPMISKAREQLQHILTLRSSVSAHVSYPKFKPAAAKSNKANDSASHQWFKTNMSSDNQFFKVLPTVEQEVDNDSQYHLFEILKKNNTSSNSFNKR